MAWRGGGERGREGKEECEGEGQSDRAGGADLLSVYSPGPSCSNLSLSRVILNFSDT